MTYGTIESYDTGRRRHVLNTDYPITHELCRFKYGWLVCANIVMGCSGHGSSGPYKTESEARKAFEALKEVV